MGSLRYQYKNLRFGLSQGLTPTVKILIIFNASFFLVQEILKIEWFSILGLVPAMIWKGWVWQLVTYMFLHGSFFHFLFNMFVLWMFGGQLERYWGSREFIKYYFITGIGAGLCTSVVNSSSFIPTIGASGAIYGLLLAYGLTFPNAIIYLYFLLPIKAKYFVLFFGIVEFIASIAPRNDMVAHLAHLGGMLFGLVYLKRKSAVNFALREFRYQTRKLKYHQELKHQSKIERVREEVDFLLDKINKIGFENLSKGERKRLDQASRFLREYSKK